MQIGPVSASDLPAVETLLTTAGLPLDGAADAFETGVLARDDGRIVAAAAVERYGASGLLRSVVVASDRRGEGLGRAIVEAAEELARERGIEELYLLTETAADWFPRLGYEPLDRAMVPEAVQASVEFTTACDTTALAMRREIRGV